MEQILLAYGIPKETVAAITILYRNTKVKVRSPDGDTEYFDIVAGVLQGDTLAPYLFIICLDYVLRTSIDKIKKNGFELTKKRSRRYPATTITDADYADDIAILANTPDQDETLLHSLERATASIGLYVNAHKTEYMCYCGTIASRHLVCRWFRDYHMCRLVFLCFFPRPRCFQIRGKRRWLRSSRWRLEFVLERWKSCQANLKNDENKAFVINSNKRLFTQLFR